MNGYAVAGWVFLTAVLTFLIVWCVAYRWRE
jgi:hypothetical protein